VEQIGRVTSDLAQSQRQCDLILQSTSWRMTAPVRVLARIAKRH
jgi:hypothetical protein